jgi:hypothetical protein
MSTTKQNAAKKNSKAKISKAVAAAQAEDASANASAVNPDLVPLTQLDKEKKAAKKPRGKSKGTPVETKRITEKAPKAAKQPKASKPDKGLSCLEAAAEVLKAAKEPMACKAMIDAMFSAKLWTSDAPTPSATLYSAILREIQKKGSASRFKKTERGQFALNV